jgi:hypothetical protein
MRVLAWDIELTPLNVWSWSLYPDYIPIQMLRERQHMLCFGARWVGSKQVIFKSTYHDGKEAMLQEVHDLLDEADATISWNGAGFDTKHVRREFLEAGMKPPSPWKEIDLMRTAKSQFKFPSNKLDYVAQDLGVGKKTEHTGFQLWLDCMGIPEFDLMNATWEEIQAAREVAKTSQAKFWPLMKRYQKQDVDLLIDLYDYLLPWIPNHPNVALYNDVPNGCKQCSRTNLQRRGFALTGSRKYQRYVCNDCGTWQRGTKSVSSDTTEMR